MIELNKNTAETIRQTVKVLKQDNDLAEIDDNKTYYLDENEVLWSDAEAMTEYHMPDELLDDLRFDWEYMEGKELTGKEVKEMIKDGYIIEWGGKE